MFLLYIYNEIHTAKFLRSLQSFGLQRSSWLVINEYLVFHAVQLTDSWGTNKCGTRIQLFGNVNCFPSPTKFRLFYYELFDCPARSAASQLLTHKLPRKASCDRSEFLSGNWYVSFQMNRNELLLAVSNEIDFAGSGCRFFSCRPDVERFSLQADTRFSERKEWSRARTKYRNYLRNPVSRLSP